MHRATIHVLWATVLNTAHWEESRYGLHRRSNHQFFAQQGSGHSVLGRGSKRTAPLRFHHVHLIYYYINRWDGTPRFN